MEIREQVPLAPLTTFGIGGPARFFVDVADEDDVRAALEWAREKGVRFYVLAGGSNVVIPDDGLDGLVLHITEGRYSFDGSKLTADFGCDLLALIREAGSRGLGGWEKLAGIPGSIGGAVRGNAGAFGSEIKDFLVSARALNTATGDVREFTNEECDLSYRHSFFKDHPEWIITKVTVELRRIGFERSRELVEETIREREKRHLQNVQAAGSFFMNPEAPDELVRRFEEEKKVKSRGGRIPAGWLIEKAGLKGAKVGGAMASLMHPNYIINAGGATAHDVLNLAQRIKLEVQEKFGVELQEEAAIL